MSHASVTSIPCRIVAPSGSTETILKSGYSFFTSSAACFATCVVRASPEEMEKCRTSFTPAFAMAVKCDTCAS